MSMVSPAVKMDWGGKGRFRNKGWKREKGRNGGMEGEVTEHTTARSRIRIPRRRQHSRTRREERGEEDGDLHFALFWSLDTV